MPNVAEIIGLLYTIKNNIQYLISELEEILDKWESNYTFNLAKIQNVIYAIDSLNDLLNELNSQSAVLYDKSNLDMLHKFLIDIYQKIELQFSSRAIDVDVDDDDDNYDNDNDSGKKQLLRELLSELQVHDVHLKDIINKMVSLSQDNAYDELSDKHPVLESITSNKFSFVFLEKFKRFKMLYDNWYDAIDDDLSRLTGIHPYDWYTDERIIKLFNSLVYDFNNFVKASLEILRYEDELENYQSDISDIQYYAELIKKYPERYDSLTMFIQKIKEFKYILDDIDDEINENEDVNNNDEISETDEE
jgi:hypothetical protein